MGRPLLLGHRGLRGSPQAAENTIQAFDLALEDGCDGFEFDVRLTGDGRAVICHDTKIGNITVSSARQGQLSRLPLLEQVIERYQRNAFLDIELKVTGLEESTLRALDEFRPQRGCVISSFLPEVITRVKSRNSNVHTGLICDQTAQLRTWRAIRTDYLMAQQKLVTPEVVREVRGLGAQIFVWTVNDAPGMKRFADWEVDGLISDSTELLVQTFSKSG